MTAYRPVPDARTLRQLVAGDYRRHGARLSNPAFQALAVFRLGQWAISRKGRLARRVASKLYGFLNYFVSNWARVYLPAETRVGADLHLIHAEGSISVHPASVLGDRVGLMHNVTIGTNMHAGAPVIGDDVFIGVNSCVLGGVRIGHRVRIGANTAVITDVPDDHIANGSPARILPRMGPLTSGHG